MRVSSGRGLWHFWWECFGIGLCECLSVVIFITSWRPEEYVIQSCISVHTRMHTPSCLYRKPYHKRGQIISKGQVTSSHVALCTMSTHTQKVHWLSYYCDMLKHFISDFLLFFFICIEFELHKVTF